MPRVSLRIRNSKQRRKNCSTGFDRAAASLEARVVSRCLYYRLSSPYALQNHRCRWIRLGRAGDTMTIAAHQTSQPQKGVRSLLVPIVGSVGVVYGDIGTSPLYAFREALRPFAHDGVSRGEVVGLIS